MSDFGKELEFALELAQRAETIATSFFQREMNSEQKADGTWVTEADKAVEIEIRSHIERHFSDHNVLGEEQGLASAGGGSARPGSPTWIIDPIDGTHNFMHGIPIWATLIGLEVDGDRVVGVCHAPALGETYEAALGLGARMNGRSISVAPVDTIEESMFLFGGMGHFFEERVSGVFEALARRCWRSRGFGDFWGHMLVARGAAQIMLEPDLNEWDVAALQPIISEAGGRLTHLDGTEWQGAGTCLTTCGTIHDQVVALATAPG